MIRGIRVFVCAIVLFSRALASATPTISLNRMLSPGGVLQQGERTLINGTAPPNSQVSVYWPCSGTSGECDCTSGGPNCPASATAAADGSWLAVLTNLQHDTLTGTPADDDLAAGRRLRIHIATSDPTGCHEAGGNFTTGCDIDITGLLVGEVWICSGQSDFIISRTGSSGLWCPPTDDTPTRCDLFPFIRTSANKIQHSQHPADRHATGGWYDAISEACFSIGVELNQVLREPIGMVERALDATAAKVWEGDSICLDAEMQHNVNSWANQDTFPGPACEKYPTPDAHWGSKDIEGESHAYKSDVQPLWPYTFKGAFWWQGGNEQSGECCGPNSSVGTYRHSLPGLARSWRIDRQVAACVAAGGTVTIAGTCVVNGSCNQPFSESFPFIWSEEQKGQNIENTQSCPQADRSECVLQAMEMEPADASIPLATEAGAVTDDWMRETYVSGYYEQPSLGVIPAPDTYKVVTSDLERNAEVIDRVKYGQRYAWTALHEVYGLGGRMSNAFAGPILDGIKIIVDATPTLGAGPTPTPDLRVKVQVFYKHATAKGLVGLTAPRKPTPGIGPSPVPTFPLRGFACMDNQSVWHWAETAMSDPDQPDQIQVTCPAPSTPAAPNTPRASYATATPAPGITPIVPLLRYNRSDVSSNPAYAGKPWGNIFNGDSMAAEPFTIDLVSRPTPDRTSSPTPTATAPCGDCDEGILGT